MKRRQRIVRPERDREVFKLLHEIQGISATKLARKAKISPGTISKWRRRIQDGGTRYPQHYTMAAVARAIGMKYELVEIESRSVHREEREHAPRVQ
jgi:transposase-like protein